MSSCSKDLGGKNTPWEKRDLVAERLGGDERDFLNDPLVGVEVEGQLGVVLLNDHPRSLLDSFSPDASHLAS